VGRKRLITSIREVHLAYRWNGHALRRSAGWPLRCSIAALLLAIAACSYQHEPFRLGNAAHGSDPDLHFVEADDYGWLWDPQQAQDALAAVKASEQTDTLVVVFVAGWHHSARCCDDNVSGFKEVLKKLQVELSRKMYEEARSVIHPGSNAPVHVMGIYIGWRGRSLPGWLDYTTFWGRKAAATRVGETDVREFLVDLRNLYELHNIALRTSTDRRLLGLITIGHSFGGQVVLRATAPFIEQELMLLGAPSAYLRWPLAAGSGPQLHASVSGFGDLVVLINPAVEAAGYQRLHALGISMGYDASQTPVILTISADNDKPRREFFPIGRVLGEIFTGKPHLEDTRERDMERKSLGFVAEQVTHRLQPVDPGVELQGATRTASADPACAGFDHCAYTWYAWKAQAAARHEDDSLKADDCSPQVLNAIAAHDFSTRSVFSDVELIPTGGNVPHQALIVASASPKVIDGHNGMFSQPLLQFLTRYIGFVEAQRFLPLMPQRDCPHHGA
jgi:hypothetical protein